MKKITLLIIIIIVFNFICLSFFQPKVYASDSSMSIDDFKQLDEGKANINGNETTINVSDSDIGSVGSKFATVLTALSTIGVKLISSVVEQGGYYHTDSDYSTDNVGIFTINSLVFGEYYLFSSKPYETLSDSNEETPSDSNEENSSESNEEFPPLMKTIDKIKKVGSSIGNLIAIIARTLCFPLVLISIFQVLKAQKADDLVAFKKILCRWIICLALLCFYRYILAAIHVSSNLISDLFWKIRIKMEATEYRPFEAIVEKSLINSFQKTGGITSLAYSIEFLAIVVMQILFIILFAMREFMIIFLFAFAPVFIFIDALYFLLRKNKNVLGSFFSKYILLVFLQAIFALFYIVFFFTLSEIVINVPALGFLLLVALYRVGNIIKAMFGLEMGSSIL